MTSYDRVVDEQPDRSVEMRFELLKRKRLTVQDDIIACRTYELEQREYEKARIADLHIISLEHFAHIGDEVYYRSLVLV